MSAPESSPLDLAIASWLHAKGGRSGSTHTRRIYEETIADFRTQPHAAGLDLDAAANHITLVAQAWADRGSPAPSTYNHRLAVVSSFYSFAAKRGMLSTNPITAVERRAAQSYAGASAIKPPSIKRMLADIDRSDSAGLRDYALLSVALQSGRRLAEIAGMRWAHLHIDGDRVKIHFRGLDNIGTESSVKHIFHKLVSDISHWNAVAILRNASTHAHVLFCVG